MNPKYRFYHGSYFQEMSFADSESQDRDFASVSSTRNEVLGYIGYRIDRGANCAYDLCIMRLSPNPTIEFVNDILKAIYDIFTYYNHNKLDFHVIIGNPVEKSYDKFLDMCNGRICGYMKQDVRIQDNTLCDRKFYEIMRDEFMSSKMRKLLDAKFKHAI